MTPRVVEAALDLQAICTAQDWKFCFIGGIAVQRWGEPRQTSDADLTLLTGFSGEDRFVDLLLAHFPGRLVDAREHALKYRVLLLRHPNGAPLDIALGALPFEEAAVQRSSPYPLTEGHSLITCCAEDLIVHKAFANREIDWFDIRGILMRRGLELDLKLVRRELSPLAALKDDAEIMPKLESLIERWVGH